MTVAAVAGAVVVTVIDRLSPGARSPNDQRSNGIVAASGAGEALTKVTPAGNTSANDTPVNVAALGLWHVKTYTIGVLINAAVGPTLFRSNSPHGWETVVLTEA